MLIKKFGAGFLTLLFLISSLPLLSTAATSPWTSTDWFPNNYSTDLDGSDEYISIADSDDLSFTDGGGNDQAFSISAWIYPDDVTGFQIFQKADTTSTEEYNFGINAGNNIIFTIREAASGDFIARKGSANLATLEGGWHHVVATYDGSESTSGINIYIDGEAAGLSNLSSGTFTGMSNTNSITTIGYLPFVNQYADGKFDEVSVWSKELSSSEIEEIYNNEFSINLENHSAAVNLVSWWRMGDDVLDDLTGGTGLVRDQIGNNNGTPTNTESGDKTASVGTTNEYNSISNIDVTNDSTEFAIARVEEFSNGKFESNINSWSTDSVPTNMLDLESGSSQYAAITDGSQTGLDITGAMTIEAWIRPESIGSEMTVAAKSSTESNQRGYRLYITSGGLLTFEVSSNGSTTTSVVNTKQLFANRTYFVTATYDPSTSLKLFVDGLNTRTNVTSIPASIFNSSADFVVGADQGASDAKQNFFDGLIKVRIFDDIRSDSEIASDAHQEYVADANLQGEWMFNDIYGDTSENDNTLTSSGSPSFSSTIPWERPSAIVGSTNLETNLVSYWQLDETSGTRVDSYGSNDLTDNNTVGSTAGIFDNGGDFEFDNNEFLSITDAAQTGLDGTGSRSVSFWYKPESIADATDPSRYLISKYRSTGSDRVFYVVESYNGGSPIIRFRISTDGNAARDTNISYTLSPDTWYHMVFIFSTDAITYGYINGVMVGWNTTNIPSVLTNQPGEFQIGAIQDSPTDNTADGIIDEVTYFDEAISYGDILDLYSLGAGYVEHETTTTYKSSEGAAKITTGTSTPFVQVVDVGDTNSYNLEAYAYTDGSAVSSSDLTLYANGSDVSTTFTSVGSGWYRLTGTVTGVDGNGRYGVRAEANKTIYVDNVSLYSYESSGTLTSRIFDTEQLSEWGSITLSTGGTGTITAKVRTSDDAGMSGATAFSSCDSVSSGSDISTNNCVTDGEQYIQYQITLNQGSGTESPTITEITIAFSLANSPPNQPSNSTPTAGSLNQSPLITLTSSAFSDDDGGDTHAASQWLIRASNDPTYSSPVYDSGTDAVNLTSIDISQGTLDENTVYYWKVRHQDTQGSEWSDYSDETSFVTGQVPLAVFAIGATEYQTDETARLTVQVKDTDGDPVNSAAVTITIYNPSGTAVETDESMSYLTGSNGLYTYTYTIPSTEGVYTYESEAAYAGETAYTSHAFHVSTALNQVDDIYTLLSTVDGKLDTLLSEIGTGDIAAIKVATDSLSGTIDWSDITGLVTTSGAIKAKTDTINWSDITAILTDTATINWTDVTGINTTVNTIAGNVTSILSDTDTLMGGLIVTTSTINDASATSSSFVTSLTNSTADFYKNAVITFTDGDLDGQTRRISAYDESTKTITVSPAFAAAPANGDAFTITKQNVYAQEQNETLDTKIDDIAADIDTLLSTLTTVDTNLSNVQSTVNALRTTQQKGDTVILSEVSEVPAGETYRAKLTILNEDNDPTDASSTPTISIYDAERTLVVTDASFTKLDDGVYEYTYETDSGDTTGLWEAVVSVDLGGANPIIKNDYFRLTGSPAQVLINTISDNSVPDITANVTITNEGNAEYEYQYTWCVVATETNACGGGDDIYNASAAKLIASGEDFITDLSATVPDTGTYYFKLIVYFGSESSAATRSFTATDGTTEAPTTGGGGQTIRIDSSNFNSAVQDIRDILTIESDRLEKLLNIVGNVDPNSPGFNSLLSINRNNTSDIKSIQNKVSDLQAVSNVTRRVIEEQTTTPIIETYLKFGSVEIVYLISNPASTQQVVKFKAFLPEEVRPEHVMDSDGLGMNYDPSAAAYYVSADINLQGKQTITKTIKISDIWMYPEEQISAFKNEANEFMKVLNRTNFDAQAAVLKNNIHREVDTILREQEDGYQSPQDHIIAFRENTARISNINSYLDRMEQLVAQVSSSTGLVGRLSGLETFSTWGIIAAVVLGFGMLATLLFAMWRHQMKLTSVLVRGGNLNEVHSSMATAEERETKKPAAKKKSTKKSIRNIELEKTTETREISEPIPRSPRGILIGGIIFLALVAVGGIFLIVKAVSKDKLTDRIVYTAEGQDNDDTAQSLTTDTVSSTSTEPIISNTDESELAPAAVVVEQSFGDEGAQTTAETNGEVTGDEVSSGDNIEEETESGSTATENSVTENETEPPPPENTDATISDEPYIRVKETSTGWLRVRSEPTTSSSELGRVYPEDTFFFKKAQDNWYQIMLPEGALGWVSGDFVEVIE